MKKFTKLFSILTLIATVALTLCFAVGCTEDTPDESSWDGRTFTVYVYKPDGTTPVSGIQLSLCYNTDGSHSSCLSPQATDANGKVTFTFTESVTFVGLPVVHFEENVATGKFNLPDGCAMPANATKITMNHEANDEVAKENSTYEYAVRLSQEVTNLVLTAAN